MASVLIKAYTEVNLGDDLFVRILTERYPQKKFTLVSQKENSIPFKDLKNVKLINSPKLLDSVLNKIGIKFRFNNMLNFIQAKKSQATVHIGGSLFIQGKKEWKASALMYDKLIENSQNFFILGCNFGPFENENYYQEYKKIFNKVNDICFRDTYSYNLFRENLSSRMAPDIVFGMDIKLYDKNIDNNYIVISVIDLDFRNKLSAHREEYENAILKIINELLRKKYKVVLMSFCRSEGDERAINRIKSKILSNNVYTYFYRGNMDESLKIISESTAVIATRFHALILALIFEKPVFPFVYSDKTLNVMNDIAFNGYHLQIVDSEKINLKKVINQLENKIPLNIDSLIINSENHFNKLDKFMNEGII